MIKIYGFHQAVRSRNSQEIKRQLTSIHTINSRDYWSSTMELVRNVVSTFSRINTLPGRSFTDFDKLHQIAQRLLRPICENQHIVRIEYMRQR